MNGSISVTSQSVAASDQDSLALVALYNSTNGGSWNNNVNWLSGPVSNWHGITLNDNGRVEALLIAENNLTGNIPSEIGDLTALKHIIILSWDFSSSEHAGSLTLVDDPDNPSIEVDMSSETSYEVTGKTTGVLYIVQE